ncbi:VOC family protein [Alkalihalobacillus sp. MEB130]|uniref:VOC family protein n=1 Tax=Alkalihalobacillus sp. MEB130 TaxID=2976704 RepID=UPI0028DF28CC|nr:VOC family protein [Alkalihalobacillus sp. MEB130]MDT8861326.1 VOC family protein [Alkalihalobacillus sp. MEB130]
MIKRVEHVGIMVKDMEKSVSFYKDILGFSVRARLDRGDKELVFLSHEGLREFDIELILDRQTPDIYFENGLVNHVAFVVDDINEVIMMCNKKGIHLEMGPVKKGMNGRKTMRFRGPNKEMLQFVEEKQEESL